jgi:tetratricopeptide (TPR) repeat protein
LLRLTGSAAVSAPQTPEQERALALSEEAGEAARRGDYALAAARLDEAERIAPRYVIVHQYRSNVAYLSGDFETAIAALERALEIEPDNALYRTNLQRLREQLERRQ